MGLTNRLDDLQGDIKTDLVDSQKYPNKLGRIAPVIFWFADRFEKELIFKTAYVLSLLQKDWVKESLRIVLLGENVNKLD